MLNQAKRNQMRDVYVEQRTDTAVHNTCHVHMRTVARYRVLDDWLGYCKKVDAAVDKKVTTKIARRRADSLKIIDFVRRGMAADLKAKYKAGKPIKFEALAFDKLVRLEELLTGNVDSRAGVRLDTPEQIQQFIDSLPDSKAERLGGGIAEI